MLIYFRRNNRPTGPYPFGVVNFTNFVVTSNIFPCPQGMEFGQNFTPFPFIITTVNTLSSVILYQVLISFSPPSASYVTFAIAEANFLLIFHI